MVQFERLTPPQSGEKILYENGTLKVPDHPIVPFIEGDGTGPDIWRAAQRVLDAAVKVAYKGQKQIHWFKVLAGEEAFKATGEWLPNDTLVAFREYRVGIKGPLTTPVGGGIRSLNVALRQELDLYQCVRPVYYVPGVPAPMKDPSKLDIVIFRENTEDVYAGVEFEGGSEKAEKLRKFLIEELGVSPKKFRGAKVGLGIKPMSEEGSKRLIRAAIKYAIAHNLPSVTLVHKGNIMKFTEGAFYKWGYEVATTEFRDRCVTWDETQTQYGGKVPEGKILVQDVIADNMFQQLQTRPQNYSVLATGNLNGDYLSDAAAGQIGGLGIAPGGNIGDGYAVFEATHGTAPKYANQDKVNPGSVVLSGVMMLEYLGWIEAANLIKETFKQVVDRKYVTYDFARELPGVEPVKCSEFGEAIAVAMETGKLPKARGVAAPAAPAAKAARKQAKARAIAGKKPAAKPAATTGKAVNKSMKRTTTAVGKPQKPGVKPKKVTPARAAKVQKNAARKAKAKATTTARRAAKKTTRRSK
ncbi:MAG TPA: isocitrate dehydrogenase (NADP(+)) [Candidatus Thermoplasmatota archaeon]|nr:isocitrate dehydrogenase (NADP(+)) [Candidatus Thermoplasmatota archaeon]